MRSRKPAARAWSWFPRSTTLAATRFGGQFPFDFAQGKQWLSDERKLCCF